MTFIKIWDIDMLLPTAFDFIRYDGIWELGNRTDRVGWRIGYEARGRRCQGRKHQKKKKKREHQEICVGRSWLRFQMCWTLNAFAVSSRFNKWLLNEWTNYPRQCWRGVKFNSSRFWNFFGSWVLLWIY